VARTVVDTTGTVGAGTASAAGPAPHHVPALAEGVELLGELDASGFKEPPCLARRGDGQTIQLTELLYRLLEVIDGRRDEAALAAAFSERIGKEASPDDVRFLVEEKLRPLGLLKLPDGSEPHVEKVNPLLALRFRFVLSNPQTTRRITTPFAALFTPVIVCAVVVAFFAFVGWLLFAEGIGAGTRQVLYSPGLLVLTFVLAAASAGFHEFGHAAALRYGGGNPGAMGAGLYLVWPAFYTDVTDSYRLPRAARLRTDLGGLFFNMVFALATFAVWAVTQFDALLVVVPLLLLQMVQQLLPFVRLDGYHILADITGVPDLFARIKPTLKSAVPGHDADSRVTALKPWVRVVVTVWVLAVIPLLLLALLAAIVTLPRLAATAWDSLGLQWEQLDGARADGDGLGIAAAVLSILALCLPVLSTVYLLTRMARRASVALWQRTDQRPVARAAVAVAGAALVALAAYVWWPNGEYRPLQPGERGRLQDTVSVLDEVPTGRPSLTEERQAELDGAPFRSDAAEVPVEEPTPTTSTTVTSETTATTEATGDDVETTTTTDATTTTTTEASTTTTTTADTTTTETTTP
jgi:putative peptide zinc metalloprotease protein